MKKTLSFCLILFFLFQLFACIEEPLDLPECSEIHSYTQASYYGWDRSYSQYPVVEYVTVYEKLGVTFQGCSSFHQAVKTEQYDTKVLDLSKQIKALKDDQIEKNFHDDGVHKPRLSLIREPLFDTNSISEEVIWYGCSEYLVKCSLFINCENIPCFVVSYGGEKFPVAKYDEWESLSFFENGIEYNTYTLNQKNLAEKPYSKTECIWSFDDGDYSYRVLEKTLKKYASADDVESVIRLVCIEIEYDSDYYYVYLGSSSQNAPTITPEIVKSFTLKSFE